jgi:hypothetical protein
MARSAWRSSADPSAPRFVNGSLQQDCQLPIPGAGRELPGRQDAPIAHFSFSRTQATTCSGLKGLMK